MVLLVLVVALGGCQIPMAQPGNSICEHGIFGSEITGSFVDLNDPVIKANVLSDCGGTWENFTCSGGNLDPLVSGMVSVSSAVVVRAPSDELAFLSGPDTCIDKRTLYQGSCNSKNLLNVSEYDCL